jgi:hypothetical protein
MAQNLELLRERETDTSTLWVFVTRQCDTIQYIGGKREINIARE